MSATDELRRLLDERGVVCGATDMYRLLVTSWNDASGHGWAFIEHRDGSFSKLTAYHLTPAQAIAASLGSGTCQLKPWEMERDTGFYDCMECGCGYVADVSDWAEWRYCPNCGARVVGE